MLVEKRNVSDVRQRPVSLSTAQRRLYDAYIRSVLIRNNDRVTRDSKARHEYACAT